MNYSVTPFGEIWSGGIFNVPSALIDKYIKLASEYQLKALLIILSCNGKSSVSQIAKTLGITSSDAEELMEFWIAEGVVCSDEQPSVMTAEPSKSVTQAPKPETKEKKTKIELTAPVLEPKDVVTAAEESREIAELLDAAQEVLGRTINHRESEAIVNMVNFYGLKSELVLMILSYCRSIKEHDKSRTIGTAFILKTAQNWMEEGIETVAQADEKLKSVEKSDRLWKEISAMAGIMHKKPTVNQREMVLGWSRDFSMDMISLAVDRMRENTDSPKLSYADKILKSWKKKGIATPADVAAEDEAYLREREAKKSKIRDDKVGGTPSFDLEEIKKNAQNNTDIKF